MDIEIEIEKNNNIDKDKVINWQNKICIKNSLMIIILITITIIWL